MSPITALYLNGWTGWTLGGEVNCQEPLESSAAFLKKQVDSVLLDVAFSVGERNLLSE